jgi:ATP-dependent Clp protease ATP-binding subunit ClpC
MFDRFTDRAKKVMSFARQEAQRLNHEYIGPEHLLLGLLDEGRSVAVNVLRDLADPDRIRQEVEEMVNPGPSPLTISMMPFTEEAKKALELSMEEALALSHAYIGTEHLLLGLIRLDGVPAQVLAKLNVKAEQVREEVMAYVEASDPSVSGAKYVAGKGGSLEIEGQRVTCQLVWTYWYESGQKRCEGTFLHGKRHGEWTFWNEDGSIDEKCTGYYEQGKRNRD